MEVNMDVWMDGSNVAPTWCERGVVKKKSDDFKRAANEGHLEWHRHDRDLGHTITERHSHCAIYLNKSVYVFGGCTSTNTTFNDLWRFDLGTKQWIRPLAMGTYPSPKACASLVSYMDTLVLFGGWSHPTPYPLHQAARYFSQLHVYCPMSNRWKSIQASNSPPGKAGHAACVIRDTMFVFGGSQRDSLSCNDLWSLDFEEMAWKQHEVKGKLPLPRYGHAMFVLDDAHLLLVGGCGGPNMQFTDVWVLDMSGEKWHWFEVAVSGNKFIPPQLWCHPLCRVGDRLIAVSKALNPPLQLSSQPASRMPGTHSLLTTQLAQIRRTLPDTSTSESSSQDSSSDTDDVVGGAGARVRPPRLAAPHRVGAAGGGAYLNRHAGESAAVAAKGTVKQHCCKKCGNHWDVCVCTSDDSVNPVNPRNNPIGNADDGAQPSTSKAGYPGEPITPFKNPFRGSRNMPSIKPNASKNRQKQLETLRKYEQKFRNQRGLAANEVEVKVSGNNIELVRSGTFNKRPTNPMYVHSLDISSVLGCKTRDKTAKQAKASWLPIKAASCVNAPDETIFYSLVQGRAELILFGGILHDMNGMQRVQSSPQVVSNNVYFLRAPTELR